MSINTDTVMLQKTILQEMKMYKKLNICYKTKEKNLDRQRINMNMIWIIKGKFVFNSKIN